MRKAPYLYLSCVLTYFRTAVIRAGPRVWLSFDHDAFRFDVNHVCGVVVAEIRDSVGYVEEFEAGQLSWDK